jgi:dipeptidyl aminopeptidase/acylaminoacyl peptidase
MWRYAALLIAFFGVASTTASAQAQTNRPSIESFFQHSSFKSAVLSPNGRYLAMLIAATKDRTVLAVMDIETLTPKIVGRFDDADIAQFQWVNSKRLVFSLDDYQLAQGDFFRGPGLYAVNRDGTEFRQLVNRSDDFVRERKIRDLLPWNTYLLPATAALSDSDDVFVRQPKYNHLNDLESVNLLLLNTRTGHADSVQRPAGTREWLVDHTGTPRIVVTEEGNLDAVQYRDPTTNQWRKIAAVNSTADDDITPYVFGPDGTFYVKTRKSGDKDAIYSYDLAKNAIGRDPVFSLADYDFTGDFIFDQKKLLGVHYRTDASGTLWFDAKMKKIQKDVDDLLPATVNHLSFGQRSETPIILVKASSDVQPDVFMLFNSETAKLTVLGHSFPNIDPKQMATKDMVHYKARDGLEIPAYLTLPNLPNGVAKKNLPMVVLVHGGPWVRGNSWEWSANAQFLASRGYAVLEPEFRGSTGFGFKHYQAGWQQWGLAMQNDIADGAKWAIAQGLVDPKRICIAGASYGGYATLMGLINDPDLFRCGINWVGVTDVNLMYSVNWSDSSDSWRSYGMPVLIGDQAKDAAKIKAASPLENAARITQPLLLVYGGSDRRVPIVHGTKFRDAVKANNKNVEWVEYPEEGHGWELMKNRIDFWTRVEKFLDRNIGKAN